MRDVLLLSPATLFPTLLLPFKSLSGWLSPLLFAERPFKRLKNIYKKFHGTLVISRNLEKSNEILIVRLTEPGSAISPTVVSNVIKA